MTLSLSDKRLGALLLERGDLSDEALRRAAQRHAETGGHLADALVELGAVSEAHLARAFEEALNIPSVALPRTEVDPEALAKVPAELAQELRAVPFAQGEGRLRVAFQDPLDALAVKEVENASSCTVEPYRARSAELEWALASYYPELGLTPSPEIEATLRRRLGELALGSGLVSEAQLEAALEAGRRSGDLLGRTLVAQGALSEAQLAELLAQQAELPYVPSLAGTRTSERLASHLLRLDALAFGAVPYKEQGEGIVVALADPRKVPEVEAVLHRPASFVVTTEGQIKTLTESLYAGDEARLGEALLRSTRLTLEGLREALAEQLKGERHQPLGEVLVALGYVTRAEVDEALRHLRAESARPGKLGPESRAKSLAAGLGYPFIDESNVRVDPFVTTLVPEGTVRRYNVMPLRLEGNSLLLAMKDPRHVFALDDIKLLTGREVRPAVATEETLIRLINRYYKRSENMEELAKAVLEEVGDKETFDETSSTLDDTAIVKVVNNIIREAILNDISDIHLEPRPDKLTVRVRKDGALREYMTMPKGVAGAMAARVKIMGRLNIAERRLPQDGRVRFKERNLEVDLRLSTLPTVYGEKVVMRILKKATNIPEIEQLGFADYNFERFSDTIQKPYGIFLITGPTGSGKSFTTFSILKRVALPEVNVTTIEDPVEYEVPGINQTQVNVKAGLTFASALRAFLRQDPDVIMIGEIRDAETAKIAVEAALTGHLVIATLHTNDAAGAVTRLEEMGVEPFNVSASLLGVLAQRLVREVCNGCRIAYTPDPEVLRRMGLSEEQIRGKVLYRGAGCEKCGGSGYNGRHAIHELLSVDDLIEGAIVQGKSATEIKEIAIQNGMKTLRDDGVFKAFAGVTTLEEVLARTTD